MAIQIYREDLTSFERVLSAALAGEEKASKEARRYRGTYTPLSCRSLLIIVYFSLERLLPGATA